LGDAIDSQPSAWLGCTVIDTLDEEAAMPQYNFLCRACKKEFSKILTLSEHEKGKIVCPHCGDKDVEQRWAAFFAVTSKTS
jgi:putative FmdB family regulatory protein